MPWKSIQFVDSLPPKKCSCALAQQSNKDVFFERRGGYSCQQECGVHEAIISVLVSSIISCMRDERCSVVGRQRYVLARAIAHIILSSIGRLELGATCEEQPTKREAEYARVLADVLPTRERSRVFGCVCDFSSNIFLSRGGRVSQVSLHLPTRMTTSRLHMPWGQQAEASSLPLRMASTFSCTRQNKSC